MGLAVAIELFGQVLQVSHWVLDISSFTHTPRLPGGMVSAARCSGCLAALALAAADRPACAATTSARAGSFRLRGG